jgi:small subunit ribosomal protein S20
MPSHKSAEKRMRSDARKHDTNKAHRSSLRKNLKAYRDLQDPAAAKTKYPEMSSMIDRAAKKGIIHRRKADRLKSRLSRKVTPA